MSNVRSISIRDSYRYILSHLLFEASLKYKAKAMDIQIKKSAYYKEKKMSIWSHNMIIYLGNSKELAHRTLI